MSKDHLDREVSLSAELTDKGIKVEAKSRFLAAVERLGGGLVDLLNAHVEAPAQRKRAKTDGEVELIKAAAKYAVEAIGSDPNVAERAYRRHFEKLAKTQDNNDGVLRAALEDLTANPPDAASSSNEAPISEEFLDRLESYSAGASTDELKERWGRVLAAEVRKPGTFSNRVLRTVDELDSNVAQLFERLCIHLIDEQRVPTCLSGELSFNDTAQLTSAGLIIDPGLTGKVLILGAGFGVGGARHLGIPTGVGTIIVSIDIKPKQPNSSSSPLVSHQQGPAVPVYVLTDVGKAVASILPNNWEAAHDRLVAALVGGCRGTWIRSMKFRSSTVQMEEFALQS